MEWDGTHTHTHTQRHTGVRGSHAAGWSGAVTCGEESCKAGHCAKHSHCLTHPPSAKAAAAGQHKSPARMPCLQHCPASNTPAQLDPASHLNVLYGRMRTLWPIMLILCRLGCRLNSTRSPFCRWRSTLSPICAGQQGRRAVHANIERMNIPHPSQRSLQAAGACWRASSADTTGVGGRATVILHS